MRVNNCGPKIEAKDYGASQTVSPDAFLLVSDHSIAIVLQMASLDSPQTELSKYTVCNTIKCLLIGVETTRWPSVLLRSDNYCV